MIMSKKEQMLEVAALALGGLVLLGSFLKVVFL